MSRKFNKQMGVEGVARVLYGCPNRYNKNKEYSIGTQSSIASGSL
jgi:hypothetical protein